MRMPGREEDLVGKICVCSVGRPFLVTGTEEVIVGSPLWPWPKESTRYWNWVGLGLDGKGTACSSNPCIIAESAHEFYQKLRDRFGGKMSPNG